ncbi:MAG TPA: hypothetical protein VMW38_23020, partial [Terriglobia bacterium]|nr:hypothetical protein [Terriglobia bacterium]
MRHHSLRDQVRVQPFFPTFLIFLFVLATTHTVWSAETFTVQWKNSGPEFPWLSLVELRSVNENVSLKAEKLRQGSSEYPNGLRATFTNPGDDPAWFRVKLALGYGFAFSDRMLEQHPYLWVRDLGLYISRSGTWSETGTQRAEAADQVSRSLNEPFVSCAQKYFQWAGLREYEPKLDQKIWEFVEEKQDWPIEARSIDHIARLGEVDASYFDQRFPDLKYSRIYLGWPDHNDEFILWNNGKIGVSSNSVGGDSKSYPESPWQPRASGYSLQFGVGEAPQFSDYGGSRVHQQLRDGFHLVVTSDWNEAGLSITQTNFAYPLDGEQIKTGVEPLLAWTKIQFSNPVPHKQQTYLGIEFTNEDFAGSLPLANIKDLAWRKGGFYLLGQLVAVADPALEFNEILVTGDRKRFRAAVQLEPSEAKSWIFANFYRPVSPARLESVRALGYEKALERTLAFWNRLDSQGAKITVPEPLFNNLYRTFLPRITINSDLDLNGFSVLQTGPVLYNRVWHHV